jgi:uncharacterized protein YecE (DUF72 family)
MPHTPTTCPRIGISGWTYTPWRGVFYPSGLPHTRELHYASRLFNSIEINGTFYSLQRPGSFQKWYEATPDNFMFSVKGARFITHMRRLRDVETPLANFLASGLFNLKEKLGPLLWQLPPNFIFDADRLRSFFRLLPRDTAAAATLAQHHDERLKGRALVEIDANRPMRHALEVRHESFATPQCVDLLREHNVALVCADTAGRWPYAEDVTADFVYLRLHGDEELYASGYSAPALDAWAAKLLAWDAGVAPPQCRQWSSVAPPKLKHRDLYVYFDNDVKVKAPFDAMALAERIGSDARGETLLQRGAPPTPKLTRKALAERVRSHWPAPVAPKTRPAPKRRRKNPSV